MEFVMSHHRSPLAFFLAAMTWAALAIPAIGRVAAGQEYANDATVGIEPQLGKTIPLDLTFNDEQGKPVTLQSLMTRPTVLLLVYLRCPNICSPMMHEVAATVDKMDLVPGKDYDLITVSFDARETPELARVAKANLLAGMTSKPAPASWRFLTGDAENITKLTHSLGYRFKKDNEDFAHSATVIFLSQNGKIVRYLPGLKILPSDMKMAILDASEGRARSFMQRIQRLCYSYDPEGKTYVVKINRIILGVTVLAVGGFVLYLFVAGTRKKAEEARTADGD